MEIVKDIQKITSAETSINTLNRVYKEIVGKYEDGSSILDYGCGKYDTNRDYANEHGFMWQGIDPYNRTEEHNIRARNFCKLYKPNIIICSNVFNVIDNDNIINDILTELYDFTTKETDVYITIYEGNKSGIGKETSKGYQRNQKVDTYKDLILEFFDVIGKRGNILKCRKVVM